MSIKLIVQGISDHAKPEEIREKFSDFRGYKDCKFMYNENNEL